MEKGPVYPELVCALIFMRCSGRQEHEVQLSAGSSAAAGIPSAAPPAPSLQQLQLQLTSH